MRHIRISLLLSIFVWAGCAQDFATLAQNAVQLQAAGNYQAAAEAYRELLKLDPSQVATHVNLAIVLVNLGQYDEAILQYQAADKLLPNDPRIAMNLALAYEKSGHIPEARERFESLHSAYPQDAKLAALLADCDLQSGNDAQVIDLLLPVAKQSADDLGVAYMLGMALLHEHRIADGEVYLDRILKNGDTAEARFLLGTRMFESGDYPGAVKQFASAAELNPKLPQLQAFYGRALLNTGDADGAVAAFGKELALQPNDYEANCGLAQILMVRKGASDALPYARRAIASHPQSADANLVLAEALAGTREFSEALSYAESAAKALPRSVEAHQTLAAVYVGLHKDTQAKQESTVAQNLNAAAEAALPGPKVAQMAPDFRLERAGSTGQVSLHDFRGRSPVVLVFGSYTCPNFRDSAEELKDLQHRYGERIPFLLVYIREAHSGNQWQSTRNTRADFALTPAVNIEEKQDHAAMCSRKLHLGFPAVVDGMDDAVEAAYGAWPSRAFIVGVDGRILYSTRLTELDFHPDEMEAVLRKLKK